MPRLLLVESDPARRTGLLLALKELGLSVHPVHSQDVVGELAMGDVHLLLVSADDPHVLDVLTCEQGSLGVSTLALVDPGNVSSIVSSLASGVIGIISRDQLFNDIAAEVKSFSQRMESGKLERRRDVEEKYRISGITDRESALIDALESVCEDVRRLNLKYAEVVSQRFKVEQALMESEAFYQSLVETLPLALLRKDLKGRFTFANRIACEEFRRPADEIIGRTDYDFFPRELAEKYRSDDRKVEDSQQQVEITDEFQTPSGDSRIARVVKTPVYGTNGSVVGIQVVFSDVTDKVKAEIDLQQTRARLQAVLDAATQMAVIAVDVNGLIDVFNTGAERMLGYSSDEMIGKQTSILFHVESEIKKRGEELLREFGKDIQGFAVVVENARRKNHEESEWTYVKKDGGHLPVNLMVTARYDLHGEIVGFLGIATDISARKKAESAMWNAKEEAEASSQAKSDFLANMSHEIRTPLNAIIGMTELVRDTELTLPQREYLGMVQDSGESLLEIVNDILDFSKIEAGKLGLEDVPFSVRRLFGDTVKSLSVRADHKQLELACHIAPEVPGVIMGDAHRLRQIVVNLVGNAIKFTDTGEVVLDVALEQQCGDEILLHLCVQDSGIGIPQDKLETIFDAFEQADTSTTRRYGGTGLGLAIVSRLVELMDGRVWVESEVGRGSQFHVIARFRNASSASVDTDATVYPPSVQGLRVLVVDDNATNRRILTEMLINWTMAPRSVSTVSEAMDELESMARAGTPYALILSDSDMPLQSGFELAQQVQANGSLCGSMIMMLTSADRFEDLARCRQFGISAYLIKPIKQSALLNAIQTAVQSNSPLTVSTTATPSLIKRTSRPKAILLAEDSLINQKLALGLLERWGHHVTIANNGEEAVKISAEHRFDLILMDLQMPLLDGLDATRIIRARERETGGHVPIIAMTAHAMKEDREMCLEVGMDNYLMKPIRTDQLFCHIEELSVTTVSTEVTLQTVSGRGIIDWATAVRAVNGDQQLLDQVVQAFMEEGPQLLKTMESAIESGEQKRFYRAIHTLKSALRTFGVASADRVEILELASKAERPSMSSETVREIVEIVLPVLDEMYLRLNSRHTHQRI